MPRSRNDMMMMMIDGYDSDEVEGAPNLLKRSRDTPQGYRIN